MSEWDVYIGKGKKYFKSQLQAPSALPYCQGKVECNYQQYDSHQSLTNITDYLWCVLRIYAIYIIIDKTFPTTL